MRPTSSSPTYSAIAAALLAIAFLAAACSFGGQADGSGEWQAIRETLGDTLVVRTVSGSIWRDTADLVPEVSIGVFEGPEEYIFGQIVSMALGADGTIYVMDRQAPALRVYNADGTYRTTFGREGGGPGEYKGPDGGLAVLSDGRVLLRDPSNARIQVYSPEGEALDTWRIRGNFNTSRKMIVDRQDRAHALILLDPEASVLEWTTGLVQIHPDGSPGDTLEIPDTPWKEPVIEAHFEDKEGNTSMSVNTIPFGPAENAALSPGGYFIHGINTDYVLTLLKPGAPLRIEKAYQPVPVASGERAEEEAREIRNMRGTDPNWRWNGPPIPDVKPPYHRFYGGEDGTVWVQVSQPGTKGEDPSYDPQDPDAVLDEWSEPLLFDVFDDGGRYLGAVRAPAGMSPYPEPLFTREWVLATVRDQYDVQTVVKFRVELPGGRPPASEGGSGG